MKILVSCDDGNKLDFKLADLLKKYDIAGLFFIPNECEHRSLTDVDILELSYNFEIGGHTKTHPEDIKHLNLVSQIEEIVYNKAYLETIIQTTLKWFCYPSGRYNENTITALKIAGFEKARTTYLGQKDDNPLRTHPDVHIYPHRAEYKGENWCNYAMALFEKKKEDNADTFHIFCHSWEIEKFNLWEETEELFKYITK